MYRIGELRDEKRALQIIEKLNEMNISSQIIFDNEISHFVIYVEREEDIPLAIDVYRVFVGLKKPIEIDQEWIEIKKVPFGPMTMTFVFVCLIVFAISFFQKFAPLYQLLFISAEHSTLFEEVKRGEVWRMVTPAFIHMGFLHILFNMLWFKDLGSVIEQEFGESFFLILFFSLAFFSNIFQYLVHGPSFGGMSGVVYGMLGFLWVYKSLIPEFKFGLPKADVGLMLFWFFLCLSGLIGNIANTAHAVGLSFGMMMAILVTLMKERSFKLNKLKFLFYSLLILAISFSVEYWRRDRLFFFQSQQVSIKS